MMAIMVRPKIRVTFGCLAVALLLGSFSSLVAQDDRPITFPRPNDVYTVDRRHYRPAEIYESPWMEERAALQMSTVDQFQVFHDFRFIDQLPESGITFRHRTVDDGARFYKNVHYDHGNGVSVADVDGDGLYDIYFVTQLGSNQLWKNAGGGRFDEITESAGVGLADKIAVTASFADIDNDGDPDLYVTTVRHGNVLFENDGTGAFEDITEPSGLGYRGHSSSAVFFDYDRDGLLDLYLTNVGQYTTDEIGEGDYYVGMTDAFLGQLYPERYELSILFRNVGDLRFENTSVSMGITDASWTGAASPMDVNDDGWLDLYVLSMQGHDNYYENVEGNRFVRKSREVFPQTPWGTMGIKTLDFDNDGHMDIFITDMHTDMIDGVQDLRRHWYAEKMKMTERLPLDFLVSDGNHVLGNAFFHNQGDGTFREISEEIDAENYWPWGLSVGDLNADGWEDAFITSSMNFPWRYGVNSVFLNNRGEKFLDSEFILGVEPRREGRFSSHWFDLDCDGADQDHRGCEGQTGQFEVQGALGSRSSAIFDLDNDGDLDIVTNDFHSEPMVLISNLSEQKSDVRYLKVDLVGSKSNRSGIGARVRVTAGGQTYTKVQDGQSGYLSQSIYPLYFGLDAATRVDQIEVTWLSETGTQVVDGPIETNQVFTITEP